MRVCASFDVGVVKSNNKKMQLLLVLFTLMVFTDYAPNGKDEKDDPIKRGNECASTPFNKENSPHNQ